MDRSQCDQLLAGPLGRTVLAELAGVTWRSVRDALGPVGEISEVSPSPAGARAALLRRLSRHPVVQPANAPQQVDWQRAGDVVTQWVAAALPVLRDECADTDRLLRRVGEVVEGFAFGAGAQWWCLQPALIEAADALREVAEAIGKTPATRWWWEPPPYAEQRWISEPGLRPPRGEQLAGGIQAATRADSITEHGFSRRGKTPTAGLWWSSLIDPDVLRSTRRGETEMAVALACRDGHVFYPTDYVDVWALQINPTAKVYEVGSLADWVELVRRYPRDVTDTRGAEWDHWADGSGPWLLPDWPRVAEDWDGVHVSVGGYLAASYQPTAAAGGRSLLAGWDPDETLWLRDVIAAAEFVQQVPSPDGP